MLVKGTLQITIVSVPRGWAKDVLLKRWETGLGCFSMEVEHPKDMVDKVIAKSEEVDDVIQRLNFISHGNRKGFLTGGHTVELDSVEHYREEFKRLWQYLSGEGIVQVMGCVVGQNTDLLKALAGMFGVPVYGGTSAENALWAFNTGSYNVAYPSGGVQEGVPRP
jgi:hypothetical protein